MRKLRSLLIIPVLAAAIAAGVGQSHSTSAATCAVNGAFPPLLSFSPAITAVYTTSSFFNGAYSIFNISGGAGTADFYTDPFGVLDMASPSGPSAVYSTYAFFGGAFPIYNFSGDTGVAIICTPPAP